MDVWKAQFTLSARIRIHVFVPSTLSLSQCMRKGLPRALGLLLSSTAAASAASAPTTATATKHSVAFLGAPLIRAAACASRKHVAVSGHFLGPAPRTTIRSLVSTGLPARCQQEEEPEQQQRRGSDEDDMARAAQQSKGKGRESSKAQSARGKKGAAAKVKKCGAQKEQPAQLKKGTRMQKGQKQETAPGTPRRGAHKMAGGGAKKAKACSMTEKRGQSRKSVEDLVPDVEEMVTKIGVELPKGKKKKVQEVKAAIAMTSDRPYRDYSKQGALEVRQCMICCDVLGCIVSYGNLSSRHPYHLQDLKKTHKVTKKGGTEKGDPFSGVRRSTRGVKPSPAEKKPPTRRRTKRGTPSVRVRQNKASPSMSSMPPFGYH